jgi:hypothetical protein
MALVDVAVSVAKLEEMSLALLSHEAEKVRLGQDYLNLNRHGAREEEPDS